MTTQPELFKAPKRPRSEEVEQLCGLLQGNGWMPGSLIRHTLPWSERKVRAVANAANGRVMSFPGSPGYRLTVEASSEERDEAVAKLLHQSGEMIDRAGAIGRVHRQSTNK